MRGIAILVVLLAGCAQSPIKTYWHPVDQSAWEKHLHTGIWLRKPDGSNFKFVPGQTLRTVLEVKQRLEQASGVRADLALAETDHPNAFAYTNKEGRRTVAFSVSFLEELGNEPDALATTMGHELAHLELRHAERRKGREEGRQALGFALGFVLGPIGTVADAGATAFIHSFTRDEEREADDLGMRWAIKAGYNPCGHKKVVAMFRKHSSINIPFLSTHPGFAERDGVADEFAKREGKTCS